MHVNASECSRRKGPAACSNFHSSVQWSEGTLHPLERAAASCLQGGAPVAAALPSSSGMKPPWSPEWDRRPICETPAASCMGFRRDTFALHAAVYALSPSCRCARPEWRAWRGPFTPCTALHSTVPAAEARQNFVTKTTKLQSWIEKLIPSRDLSV